MSCCAPTRVISPTRFVAVVQDRPMRAHLLAFGLLLASPLPAYAQSAPSNDAPWLDRREEGWFWYKDPPKPARPKPSSPTSDPASRVEAEPVQPPAPPPTAPSTPPPEPYSSAWIREQLPRLRDLAMDEPTSENVRLYMLVQRAAMDKASAFTQAVQQIVPGDPWLDETFQRPLSSFGASAMNAEAGKGQQAALAEVATKAGILFVFRSDCPYCHRQAPVLRAFADAFGFEVFAVSLDGKPMPGGLFSQFTPDDGRLSVSLQVRATPALFLMRPPKDYLPLAQGALSFAEFADRALRQAQGAGLISQAVFEAARPVRPALDLDAALAAVGAGGMPGDPGELQRLIEGITR